MNTFILLLLIATSTCIDYPYDEERGLLDLTEENFDRALKEFGSLFVMFYQPDCIHCDRMYPDFEAAAAELRKYNLRLAKVDGIAEKKLTEKFNIEGFPTIILLNKDQEPMYYEAEREKNFFVRFMRKRTIPVVTELHSMEEVEKFKKSNEVVLIHCADDEMKRDEFWRVSNITEDYFFGSIVDKALMSKLNCEPENVILFKDFDEGKNTLKEFTMSSLRTFMTRYSYRKLLGMDDRTAPLIFGENNPAVIIYADENDPKWNDYKKILVDLYDKKEGKLKMVLTDIKKDMGKKLGDFVGFTDADLPKVQIADTTTELIKYNMDAPITEENILKFLADWENKKLKGYYKSQDPSIVRMDNYVKILVGETYSQEVLDNDKDVLVFWYAPWCGHCRAMTPKYHETAKRLRQNKNLIVAKIDATLNEHETVFIDAFPKVIFYKGNQKNKPYITYQGDRTVDDEISFIKKNAYHKIKLLPEEQIEKEKKEEEEERIKQRKLDEIRWAKEDEEEKQRLEASKKAREKLKEERRLKRQKYKEEYEKKHGKEEKNADL